MSEIRPTETPFTETPFTEAALDAQIEAARQALGSSRPMDAACALNNAANIRRALAERAKDPNALIEAVGLYGQALSLAKRWRAPFHWTVIRLNRARAACAVADLMGSKSPDAALGREQSWVRLALSFSQHWIRLRFGRERLEALRGVLDHDAARARHGVDMLDGGEWRTRAQPLG